MSHGRYWQPQQATNSAQGRLAALEDQEGYSARALSVQMLCLSYAEMMQNAASQG